MSDDPKRASEPTTEEEGAPTTDERATAAGGRPTRDRHRSRVSDASVPGEAPDPTEPDTTDMDATGDDGQVFGG